MNVVVLSCLVLFIVALHYYGYIRKIIYIPFWACFAGCSNRQSGSGTGIRSRFEVPPWILISSVILGSLKFWAMQISFLSSSYIIRRWKMKFLVVCRLHRRVDFDSAISMYTEFVEFDDHETTLVFCSFFKISFTIKFCDCCKLYVVEKLLLSVKNFVIADM